MTWIALLFTTGMASAFPIVLVLVIVVGLMATSWFSTRKGPHQTCVYLHRYSLPQLLANDTRSLIRTSLLLTLTCCYLMWAIAYLAQLHPLEGGRVLLRKQSR